MAKCITCGCDLSFFQGDENRRCASCSKENAWPVGHPKWREPNGADISPTTPNRTSATNAPKTGAATLTYLSALIIAICSVISCLVLLAGNNGFMGFMILVSGLGGAIFFMIMAEISHNVASLVRLANAKKEEE